MKDYAIFETGKYNVIGIWKKRGIHNDVQNLQFKSIRARLFTAFILLTFYFVGFSIYNYFANERVISSAENIVQNELQMLTASEQLTSSISIRTLLSKVIF